MKILAIISSPRKQNTYNAIKNIESIHKSTNDCEYEYLFLHKVDLKPCIGCHLYVIGHRSAYHELPQHSIPKAQPKADQHQAGYQRDVSKYLRGDVPPPSVDHRG